MPYLENEKKVFRIGKKQRKKRGLVKNLRGNRKEGYWLRVPSSFSESNYPVSSSPRAFRKSSSWKVEVEETGGRLRPMRAI